MTAVTSFIDMLGVMILYILTMMSFFLAGSLILYGLILRKSFQRRRIVAIIPEGAPFTAGGGILLLSINVYTLVITGGFTEWSGLHWYQTVLTTIPMLTGAGMSIFLGGMVLLSVGLRGMD